VGDDGRASTHGCDADEVERDFLRRVTDVGFDTEYLRVPTLSSSNMSWKRGGRATRGEASGYRMGRRALKQLFLEGLRRNVKNLVHRAEAHQM
jgi:hypothetical protein